MADTKISALAAVTTVDDTDEYAVARAGASKKITGANLKAGAVAAHLADTGDAHDASAISIVDAGTYFTGTDVEAALQELGGGGGGGSVASDTIWDAKGDLAVGSAADTAARLAVGSNDNVVVADSGQTLGMKWAKVGEAMILLADVTTNDVTSAAHGFAPKSPADATKFLNGAATPAYALVKDSDLSTSDITTNNVSTSKHGFAPKVPNDATKYLDGTGAYSVPAGGGGSGGAAKLFDSTLVATATSIDTGASGVAGGYAVLEIYIYARGGNAGSFEELYIRFNNDATAVYDHERITGTGTGASAAGVAADNGLIGHVAGNNAPTSVFGSIRMTVPNYDGTVGFKAATWTEGYSESTTSNSKAAARSGSWRSTAAISRVSIQAAFSATQLRIGTRLVIFGLN